MTWLFSVLCNAVWKSKVAVYFKFRNHDDRYLMKALNNFLIRDDNPSIDLFLLFLFKEHCLQYLEEITCSINFAQKWLLSIGHCRSLHGFQKILAECPSFSMCRWLAIFSWSTKHSKQPKQESWLQRRKRNTTCLHLLNHEDSSEELNAQEYLPY